MKTYTTEEASKLLKVHKRTIYRMLKSNKFPSAYRYKHQWFIPEDDIIEHLPPDMKEQKETQRDTQEQTQSNSQEHKRTEEGTQKAQRDTQEQTQVDNQEHKETGEETQMNTVALAPIYPRIKHHLYVNLGFLRYEHFRYVGEHSIIYDAATAVKERIQKPGIKPKE